MPPPGSRAGRRCRPAPRHCASRAAQQLPVGLAHAALSDEVGSHPVEARSVVRPAAQRVARRDGSRPTGLHRWGCRRSLAERRWTRGARRWHGNGRHGHRRLGEPLPLRRCVRAAAEASHRRPAAQCLEPGVGDRPHARIVFSVLSRRRQLGLPRFERLQRTVAPGRCGVRLLRRGGTGQEHEDQAERAHMHPAWSMESPCGSRAGHGHAAAAHADQALISSALIV